MHIPSVGTSASNNEYFVNNSLICSTDHSEEEILGLVFAKETERKLPNIFGEQIRLYLAGDRPTNTNESLRGRIGISTGQFVDLRR